MNSKRILTGIMLTSLVLTGCNRYDQGDNQSNDKTGDKKVAMTTGRVDTSSYQALMVDGKYETSTARGLSASRLNSNYNLKNFEKGLLELSKEQYSVNDYYFREGQELARDQIMDWVEHKSKDNPTGLNSEDEQAPLVFQQVLEQDYIHKNSQTIAGMSLGIALNKIDYSKEPPVEIDDATLESEGKRVAAEMIKEIREMKGLGRIPITIGLYEQAPQNDSVGGHYFAKTTTKNARLGRWEAVNEQYFALPAAEGTENTTTTDGLNAKYIDFKNNVQGFFPNLSGFSGVGYYRDGALKKVTIKIETKYFSQTEIESFTQYVGKSVENSFNLNAEIEVQINTLDGPQALVIKKADDGKAISHVYDS